MNEHIEKFTAYFNQLVTEYQETEKQLRKELLNVKAQNKVLLGKLVKQADATEVSTAEILLLEENERLIEENWKLKNMNCKSLTMNQNC